MKTSTGMAYVNMPTNLKAAVDAAFDLLPMASHHFMWGTYFPEGTWLHVYDWHCEENDEQQYGTLTSLRAVDGSGASHARKLRSRPARSSSSLRPRRRGK